MKKNRKDEYFLFLYDKDGNYLKELAINKKQFLDILDKIRVFQNKYNFGDSLEVVDPKIIEKFSKHLQLYIDKMGLK